jgi:hypothetical protein
VHLLSNLAANNLPKLDQPRQRYIHPLQRYS